MESVQALKSTLRKEIKQKLLHLTKEQKQVQSNIIANKLLQLSDFKQAKRISVYLSTDLEVDTTPILKDIFERNKLCFVPRYQGDKMEMVRLHSMDDFNSLPLTKWNIKQPCLDEYRHKALETGGLDLIIVPGVAFSRDGRRLGHGKGYYDKYFKQCFQQYKPITIGLAFKEQLTDNIPTHDHDVKLDLVLTSTNDGS